MELPGRAGVAAAQIGVGLRAFSYNVDGDIGYILNPVARRGAGEPELVDEGCLSVPGLWFPTPRYPVRAGRRASTSTGRSRASRATGSWPRRCSTRPTTSTACSTSIDLEEPRREAMRQMREIRLVLTPV